MGHQLVLLQARHRGRMIGAALCIRGADTLYGRYWGCCEEFHSLHFETCYYQGIEYCIAHGLQRFEPGAQGQHKVWRGFLPTPTWSAHWLARSDFRRAIGHFLDRETDGMKEYMHEMDAHSPFKSSPPP